MMPILLIVWFGGGNLSTAISLHSYTLEQCEQQAAAIKQTTPRARMMLVGVSEYVAHKCVDLRIGQ